MSLDALAAALWFTFTLSLVVAIARAGGFDPR